MNAKSVLVVVLLLFVLIVIFQNTQAVEFRILFWKLTMSRIIWLLMVLLVGFAAGYLTGRRYRSSKEVK